MRIVLVNRYATEAGGAEKHAVGLAAMLRRRGHSVAFLSTEHEGNVEREGAFVSPAGGDFWRGPPPARRRLEVAAAAIWNRRAANAMEELITRLEPDVVHAHDLYPQLSAAPVAVAARRGVPVVQTIHNYELISASPIDHRGGWTDRGDSPISIRALRTALLAARKALHVPCVATWIAVSRAVAGTFARHGIRAEVLPNFVDASSAAERGFERREGILFAGRLTEEKGVRDVIGLARRSPGVRVTVAGHGPLERTVADAARELGNLEWAGLLDGRAVGARLAAARLAVVPSRWEEPAGLVALEAMAQGTPVVAYNRGGLAEYVRDGGAGPVVEPHEAALAAASASLYHDADAWAGYSARGRVAAREAHSPERYVRRIEELYARAGDPAE